MDGYKHAMKFVSTLLAGCLISVFLGRYLDELFGCEPIILLALLAYTMIGSLVLLVKGFKDE